MATRSLWHLAHGRPECRTVRHDRSALPLGFLAKLGGHAAEESETVKIRTISLRRLVGAGEKGGVNALVCSAVNSVRVHQRDSFREVGQRHHSGAVPAARRSVDGGVVVERQRLAQQAPLATEQQHEMVPVPAVTQQRPSRQGETQPCTGGACVRAQLDLDVLLALAEQEDLDHCRLPCV